ncbi:hypothetical protein TI03_05455, partial [Achromatium sp. WMS1]
MLYPISHKLSVAPMLHRTDRWFRYCARLLTTQTLLYTEMIHTGALLHGDIEHLLYFDPIESPLALQLGGNNPESLAKCAKMVAAWGYSAINLNIGCPSPRVQMGEFGACLMRRPELVAECVAAMQEEVTIPITVKHRIGIDNQDSYDDLVRFINVVNQAGCSTFIIHARKAWLEGLNPKQNRTIPPLNYDMVHAIKRDFPSLNIILNGGIKDLDTVRQQLNHVDGVMIGRAAYEDLWLLSKVDHLIFNKPESHMTRIDFIDQLTPWIEREVRNGTPITCITRHLMGLFRGQSRGRLWRRYLTEKAHLSWADAKILQDAMK